MEEIQESREGRSRRNR